MGKAKHDSRMGASAVYLRIIWQFRIIRSVAQVAKQPVANVCANIHLYSISKIVTLLILVS